MIDDYFSDEAIQARVNQRMARFRHLFIHVGLMFVVIFGVIVLAAVGTITEPIIAVAIVMFTILSMIVHGMTFGLKMMRESFMEDEVKAAQRADEKRKHEDLTLSDDGELIPLQNHLHDDEDDTDGGQYARS
jgi:uncharacterized protein YacL